MTYLKEEKLTPSPIIFRIEEESKEENNDMSNHESGDSEKKLEPQRNENTRSMILSQRLSKTDIKKNQHPNFLVSSLKNS